ncbi:amino acid transporter [Vanrija albida]|uniref:Amino acid transporter n=1 Tax=Vanrija albida TaxID=181172 RepID=A0ABR3Q043_9TREE
MAKLDYSDRESPGPYEGANEKALATDFTTPVDDGSVAPHGEETHRSLKPRQLSMIAIGGAIGAGFLIGSGTSLARSGPASMLIAYICMGFCCFSVMIALGEMSTKFPTKKGFSGHATRCVDPAFGFATALIYLCKYLIISPNQLVAGALMIRYWNHDINGAVWVTILGALVFGINLLGVKWFGEVEFWLSLFKIIVLTGLIILGLIIDLGGVPGQDRIGFRYWKKAAFKSYKLPGKKGQFLGFVNALVLALLAFMGSELIGMTVGEAKNPRKTIPSAVKKTFFRIAFFFVFGTFVVGLVADSTSPLLAAAAAKGSAGGASASPWVVAIKLANIKVLPGLINGCLLVYTISAAVSDQYISSRTLYGMAMDGHAPAIFKYCTRRGVPLTAFAFTGSFMGLAYLVAADSALSIFNYFVNSVTICGGLSWISILASHIGFMRGHKAQNIPRSSLPFAFRGQPYMSYIALIMVSVLMLFKGFDSFMPLNKFSTAGYKTFITHYVGIPVYIFGYFGYKIAYRTKIVDPREMDLVAGGREFDDVVEDDEEELAYKALPFKGKVAWQIKNW